MFEFLWVWHRWGMVDGTWLVGREGGVKAIVGTWGEWGNSMRILESGMKHFITHTTPSLDRLLLASVLLCFLGRKNGEANTGHSNAAAGTKRRGECSWQEFRDRQLSLLKWH